ncbi:MAG: phosphoglycerate dehydrogenase [Phycisphaeraceae bacterium]|nr:MAG: phosphoglycerate dehydrogenase [Phycisphaeraceae bacterium]
MRVIIADKAETELIDGLNKLGCDVEYDASLGPETLPAAFKKTGAEALIVRSTKVPASVIDAAAGSLKLVIRAGSGYDNIDCNAAAAKGVAVCNTPGMNAVAVAELAMGHLIALDRHLPDQNAELKAGHWNKKKYSVAQGLKGRSLLVVGAGAIGREVITRAQAFGMKVSAYDVVLTAEMAKQMGVGYVDATRAALLKALPGFDAVTLHVPAIDATKGMCDAEFFGAMKAGAYFINTSRGPVVNEGALAEAVSSGKIRAGIDVYCNQPAEKDLDWKPDIAAVDGVYCTHHCGASTDQAQIAVAEEVVRMIGLYQSEGRIEHCVNGVA